MKPSKLLKDDRFNGRINKVVKKLLKEKGITVQQIVDKYIDKHLKAETKLKER